MNSPSTFAAPACGPLVFDITDMSDSDRALADEYRLAFTIHVDCAQAVDVGV